jgi:hypothetical protein
MQKPVVKMFLGGAVTAVRIGDQYKDPTDGKVVTYDQVKLLVHLTKGKAPLTFTKEAWESMVFAVSTEEIQNALRGWK